MYTSQAQKFFHAKTAHGNATLRCHYIGAHPIICHYLKRMNLGQIINDCLGSGLRHRKKGEGIPYCKVIETLVHNFVVSPMALYRIGEWIAPIEACAIGIEENQKSAINDDRIARALEAIASDKSRNLFFRLALRIIKDFALCTNRIHFDTTTVSFSGDYHSSKDSPHICRGHNKDGRPDLKQLVFGLNVTADGAIPLLHNVWSGNQNDATVHRPNISDLRHLLCKNDFIYVADCKLCTSKNLSMINEGGGKFVTILPRKRKEDTAFREYLKSCVKPPMWHFLFKTSLSHHAAKGEDILSTCASPFESTAEGYRIIWIKSSVKARIDKEIRENAITNALEQLRNLKMKINRGKLRTRTAIRNAITTILQKNGIRKKGFITISLTTIPRSKPKSRRKQQESKNAGAYECLIGVSLNKENLKRHERTDGVYPLITNLDASYGKRAVAEIYKYQPYIEKRFAALKSEMNVAPLFLKKTSRITGMLHIYFIASALASLIERTIRTNMKKANVSQLILLPEDRMSSTPTCPRVLEAFSNVCWYELRQDKEENIIFPLQLDQRQIQLLELLEVPLKTYS